LALLAVALFLVPLGPFGAPTAAAPPHLRARNFATTVPGAHPWVDLPQGWGTSGVASPSCGGTPAAISACAAAAASLSSSRPRQGSVQWNQTCVVCAPSPRYESAMTFDATDGYVLLFGGLTTTLSEPDDTWTYLNGTWTNITSTACASGCPSPRFGMGMTYDPGDGYVVLFGGAEYWSNTYYDDTWTFSGGVWSQAALGCSPSISCPSARYYPSMTYDGADHYVMLFGGATATFISLDDVWSFVGGGWTLGALTSKPESREAAGLAYDAKDGYVVLFGGIGGTSFPPSKYFSDTWEYLGGSWTQLSPTTSPSGRGLINFQMAYDSALGQVLLFGGSTHVSPFSCDGATWTFTGGQWTQQSPVVAPSPRLGAMLSDDPADGTAVEFGGYVCGASPPTASDTWTYYPGYPPLTATLSASPSATDIGHAVTFSSTVYGGGATFSIALRFDDGGSSTSTPVSHTYTAPGTYTAWLWANNTLGVSVTSTVTVRINPLPKAAPVATPNPTDVGVPVNFSAGLSGGTAPFTFSWTFGDGTSSGLAYPFHTYRSPGTYSVHVWSNDSIGYPANGALTVTVNSAPSVTASATPQPVDVGVPVAFTSTPAGGTPPFTVAWRFGDGTAGTGATASHAYAASGNYTAVVWANDSGGGSASLPVLVRVNPALVLSKAIATPSPADAGTAVAFSGLYWGGTPAYATTWRFGDGGSSVAASPSHAFGSKGNYTVWLWVNDSGGGRAATSVPLTVLRGVAIVSFLGNFTLAAPGVLDEGQALGAHVIAYGGLSPLTFAYTGLPAGCTSRDSPWVSCAPTATGSFVIEAQVTDASGHSVYANLSLTVHPALSIASFSASRPEVTVGAGTVVTVATSGGTSPLNYSYLETPPGCAPVHVASFSCFPARAGADEFQVEVRDGAGAIVLGNLTLQVNALPTIPLFHITPENATVGQSLTISFLFQGGTGPLSYNFSGLPSGCSSPPLGGETCTANGAGTFDVVLTVTDADGRQANATAVVMVAGGPNPLLVSVESFWWGWVLILLIVAVGVGIWTDRRRKGRTQMAQGDEMGEIAPAPEGHPLVDDDTGAPPPSDLDVVAPRPPPGGPEAVYGYIPEPELPPPPVAQPIPPPPPPSVAPSATATPVPAPGVQWVAVPIATPTCPVCHGPLDEKRYCLRCNASRA
jgi:PKD repeat protein